MMADSELTIYGIISSVFVFLIGFGICLKIGKIFDLKKIRVFYLYAWHSAFCFLACWYSLNFVSDAWGYYEKAQEGVWGIGLGTGFVEFLTTFFHRILKLSFVGIFLVFNLFGVIGLLGFDAGLRKATALKRKPVKILATAIVFLPSISFWSSSIGKDAISFMAVGVALWSSLCFRNRVFALFIAILLMMLVRPHIALIMLVAWVLAVAIDPLTSKKRKAIILAIFLCGLLFFVPFVLNYSGYSEIIGIGELSEFIEARQGYNMDGGGGVDISNMGLFAQLTSYMFRPFVHEVNNVFSAAAAFDNLILIGLFFVGIFAMLKGSIETAGESRAFLWVYSLLVWLLLATTTSNMGIALRQKWMFAPMLIFLMISVMGKNSIEGFGGKSKILSAGGCRD